MPILSYGEDALTLWALKHRLKEILEQLNDSSDAANCLCFFRPSFGRSGGPDSAQFGEFDFLIFADRCIYLGESKWDRSPEPVRNGKLELREEQRLRHVLLRFYIREWAFGSHLTWAEFEAAARRLLDAQSISKPPAPATSRLAENLQALSDRMRQKYALAPQVQDVLLFFHQGARPKPIPDQADAGFQVVPIDYMTALDQGFVGIEP